MQEMLSLITRWRMSSSGTIQRVALEKTNVSEVCIASIIRVTRIGELETSPVTSNLSTLQRDTTTHYKTFFKNSANCLLHWCLRSLHCICVNNLCRVTCKNILTLTSTLTELFTLFAVVSTVWHWPEHKIFQVLIFSSFFNNESCPLNLLSNASHIVFVVQ
jgi:hypothetical protein